MADYCQCGVSLGTQSQLGLLPDVPAKCITCVTKDRIRHVLAMLPTEDEREFADLASFEQQFLPSVRRQFGNKGILSERQIEILEQIYERRR